MSHEQIHAGYQGNEIPGKVISQPSLPSTGWEEVRVCGREMERGGREREKEEEHGWRVREGGRDRHTDRLD